jgi:hypothetical protein
MTMSTTDQNYIASSAKVIAGMLSQARAMAAAGKLQRADLSIIESAQDAIRRANRPGRPLTEIARDTRRVMASLRR